MVARCAKEVKDNEDESRRSCNGGKQRKHKVGGDHSDQNTPSTVSRIKDFTVP